MGADKDLKVDIYDQNAVKQLLDDVAAQHFLDRGYAEDHTITNLKMGIGATACGLAVLSHIYPLPFPENVFVLKFCCISYFILSAILQLILQFKERNAILFTKETLLESSGGGKGKGKKKKKSKTEQTGAGDASSSSSDASSRKLRALVVSSYMLKYDENYTIEVEARDGSQDKASTVHSIGKWFDDKGVLDRDAFLADVKEVADKVIQKKGQ